MTAAIIVILLAAALAAWAWDEHPPGWRSPPSEAWAEVRFEIWHGIRGHDVHAQATYGQVTVHETTCRTCDVSLRRVEP
jgi:hypothetical protein